MANKTKTKSFDGLKCRNFLKISRGPKFMWTYFFEAHYYFYYFKGPKTSF